MRTLLIASERPPVRSGVAQSVGRLSDGLRARGHSVDVLAGIDASSLTVGAFRFNTLASRWRSVGKTLSGYDVVNVHGPAPTISDAYLALLHAVPRARRPLVIYTHHFSIDMPGWRRTSRAYDGMHRALARSADRIVVTSRSYAAIMSTRNGPPVDVVPWGVDLDRFSKYRRPATYDGSRPLRLLFVGQMREYKGIRTLLEAVAGAPELRLTLAGSGRLEPEYRDLAARCDAHFAGGLTDASLSELYLEHDVVVMPSTTRLEAFGLTLLEGMAAGCVPVASDLPGVRDVAGVTGRLVRPGDAAAWRDELVTLAHEPRVVCRLQQSSRARAARFTWATTIDSYERLFLDACQVRVPAAAAGTGSSPEPAPRIPARGRATPVAARWSAPRGPAAAALQRRARTAARGSSAERA